MHDDIDSDGFHIRQVLQELRAIVQKRLSTAESHLDCMLFPSKTTAQRFASRSRAKGAKKTVEPVTSSPTGQRIEGKTPAGDASSQ